MITSLIGCCYNAPCCSEPGAYAMGVITPVDDANTAPHLDHNLDMAAGDDLDSYGQVVQLQVSQRPPTVENLIPAGAAAVEVVEPPPVLLTETDLAGKIYSKSEARDVGCQRIELVLREDGTFWYTEQGQTASGRLYDRSTGRWEPSSTGPGVVLTSRGKQREVLFTHDWKVGDMHAQEAGAADSPRVRKPPKGGERLLPFSFIEFCSCCRKRAQVLQ
mmetsp:Transcript_106854/g.300420  ORF Transcript_106854/g.300420 Transcript_106854/m.300420 type:complete len:218 (-) Transcript_106854:11-664(-)